MRGVRVRGASRVLPIVAIVLFLSSGWPPLPAASAGVVPVHEERFEVIASGMTTSGAIAAIDCTMRSEGQCSLRIDPQTMTANASAEIAIGHQLGKAPYVVSVYFRHAAM